MDPNQMLTQHISNDHRDVSFYCFTSLEQVFMFATTLEKKELRMDRWIRQ